MNTNNDIDDDASIAQREAKIQEMRNRVEARLQSLLHGDPLDKLRQQVSDLRESTLQQSQTSLLEEQDIEQEVSEMTWNTTTTNNNEPPSIHDIHFDPSVATASTALESSTNNQDEDVVFDPKESLFVRKTEISDPYGDAGSFTGYIDASSLKPHGQGQMDYYDGRIYEGEWEQGRWHGTGSVKFANGDCYSGGYVNDQRSGEGIYLWKDGRSYQGGFKEDMRNGLGTYKWPDGACYKGFFKAGHREGEGTYKFADGSVYTGEWKEGKYNGLGECRWADGRVYKGQWKMGKAHGYGIETRANGTLRHDGEWYQDEPVRKHMTKR